MQDEREAAKSRGSDFHQTVSPFHWIGSNGILYRGSDGPEGRKHVRGPAHEYYPFAHPELVGAVAKLTEGNEEAVLQFAQQWGLLGYYGFLLYHHGWVELDNKGEWVTRGESFRGGDPLHWIWAHAETVRRILRLIQLLREGTEGQLSRYLSSITYDVSPTESYPSGEGDYFRTTFRFARGIEPIVTMPDFIVPGEFTVTTELHSAYAKANPMTPRKMANDLVSQVLNGNLQGVEPWVSTLGEDRSALDRTIAFPALLSAVYWHLSDHAIGVKTYIECQWCRAWILQEHGLQKYCPPPTDDFGRVESRCSLKARQAKCQLNKRRRARQAKVSMEESRHSGPKKEVTGNERPHHEAEQG